MHAQFSRISIVLVLVALLLAACLGSTDQATPLPTDLAYTEAAKTIVAEFTQNSPATTATLTKPAPTAEQLPATSTPLPTRTTAPTLPPPTLQIPPTATPAPVVSQDYRLAFSDNFDLGNSGWYLENTKYVKFGFSHGGYTVKNLSEYAWKVSARVNKNMQFWDTRVEVTGSRMMGSLDGFYGVVCNFADLSHYYFMAVSSNGWYGIGKMYFSIPYILTEGVNTSVVRTGNAPNHIIGECTDHTLAMTVNGNMLAVVQDFDLSAGGVGVMVGTRLTPGYQALFDDFKVSVLE